MESMENVLVCNCKKVTYADIENALHQLPTMTAVEQQFEGVQKITHCSTGCGGCHDKIMKIISDIMYP
ncbi:(2Fe-2S)-binding protein [Neobittarella massiliensis]|nr:(2Fe-2S)-binding protein [Neobittarella massiliensis]SCJ36501.1 BFD-like [2Fe-2S] binding domain [uncultured Anaerotruncus sp.]